MSIATTNAVIDLIEDAIADSFGPDWNAGQAAHHVMQWLQDAGLQIVAAPKRGTLEIIGKKRRGTECPSSHDGFHHVDTSMESGPNNCFHCERSM